jgi:DNA recombination protein RmuC
MPDVLLFSLIGLVVGVLIGGGAVALMSSARATRFAADRARLEAELRASEEQKTQIGLSQIQLREAFAALSHDALRSNRQDFLQNATCFAPMRDTLGVRIGAADVDKAREGSDAVAAQLRASGAQKIRASRRGSRARCDRPTLEGRGEIQPKRGRAGRHGLLPRLRRKPSSTTDEGRLTPDMVVKLPGDGSIVIDAKVPIDAYPLPEAASMPNATSNWRRTFVRSRNTFASATWFTKQFENALNSS